MFSLVFAQVSSYILYLASSRSDEAEARAFIDAEWQAANEPRLSALEATDTDQASRLESAAEEKSRVEDKMADLWARLLKA